MSGVEPLALVGLICEVIAIVCKIKQVHDTATDISGLDAEMRAISDAVPLMLSTLRSAEDIQTSNVRRFMTADSVQRREIAETTNAIQPVLLACQRYAAELQDMLFKLVNSQHRSGFARYGLAVRTTLGGKRERIQTVYKSLTGAIDSLRNHYFFQMASGSLDSVVRAPQAAFRTEPTEPTVVLEQSRTGAFHWHNDGMIKIGNQGMQVIHGGQTVNL